MIQFGTDGVRGSVDTCVTPQLALQLGWAAGRVLSADGPAMVIIGKDTRISGYMLEAALQAGFIAAGADVQLVGPLPTPAIAFLTRTVRADAGVVISASHNSFEDNGIKFFNANGGKTDDSFQQQVEQIGSERMRIVAADRLGRADRMRDAAGRYIEFCKSAMKLSAGLDQFRVVVDCAHGAGYQVFPQLLRELGASVICIGVNPDGLNINSGYGSTAPGELRKKVRDINAELGIGIDGDGDRLILVDQSGEIYDGDDILFMLARGRFQLLGDRLDELPRGIVGTEVSNYGMDRAMANLGVEFVRSSVGDRHVLAELQQRKWSIGGEESGHILCREYLDTSDAAIAAVQILDTLAATGSTLAELRAPFERERLPRERRDIPVSNGSELIQRQSVLDAISEARQRVSGDGAVVVRASGTEPVVRLVIDHPDRTLAAELMDNLVNTLRSV